MGFSCGFVGLPNVGKSTLFNALSGGGAAAANFPFCTIEPNTGIVPVPDPRLQVLSDLESSAKIVPAAMKFIDIAGLVKGASQGSGLGNQFLGHIRSVDAIAHVARLFADSDVVHVEGKIDPVTDLDLIITELMLADLDFLQKRLDKSRKALRAGDAETKAELEAAAAFRDSLADGKIPSYDRHDAAMSLIVKNLGLLSMMPAFVCANTDEESFKSFGKSPESLRLIDSAKKHGMEVVPVCAKLEEEISKLSPEDAALFLEDLGVKERGLDRVVHTGYRLLDYITFFTTGADETRAWTITSGTAAPAASGKIHTDMERGFIRMEVVSYEDLIACGGWSKTKTAGKLRIEGKEYIVRDGDCVYVRFSV